MVIDTAQIFRQFPALLIAAKDTTERYIKLIESQLERNDPEKYNFVSEEFKRYPSVAAEIVEYGKIATIDDLIELYNKIYSVEDGARIIRELLDSEIYYQSIIGKMSSTFDINIIGLRTAAEKAWSNYDNYIHDATDEIFTNIAAGLSNKDIGALIASRSRAALGLLQIIAPNAPALAKRKINTFIERQKDEVLGASRNPAALKSLAPAQALPFRFGFVPITASMNVYDLGKLIIPSFVYDPAKNRVDNLRTIADTLKVGIIISQNMFGAKMEFNIRGLIDQGYISEIGAEASIMDGLSKASLKRFATIVPLGTNEGAKGAKGAKEAGAKTPSSYYRNIPADAKELIYFDSLDGYHFRVMGTFNSPNKYTIDVAAGISGLIYGASDRPVKYNKIMEDEIFARCITKTTEPAVRRAELLEPGIVISGDIFTKGMSRDTSAIKTKISENIIESIDFNKIGREDDYKKIFRGALENLEGILMKVLPSGLSSEENVTYIYKIVDLTEALYKELNISFSASKLGAEYLSHVKDEDFPGTLRNIFREMIDRALDYMDSKGMWSLYDASLKELYINLTNIY